MYGASLSASSVLLDIDAVGLLHNFNLKKLIIISLISDSFSMKYFLIMRDQ